MSSEALRNELVARPPNKDCCRLAELSALFHTAGSLHLRGRGDVSAHLDLASSAVARRAFSLLRGFGVLAEIRTYRRRAFDRATRFELHVEGGSRALQLLHEAGVVDARLAPLSRPPARVVGRACCRGAYVRGALLGAGSLSGPRSPHLEIRTATRQGAEFLAGVAAVEDVRLQVVERPRHAAAYAKGVETIADLLALAGASDTALGLGERAVVAAARASANRLANADHANLVRTSDAAHAQLRAARRLAAEGRLETLPPPLRELAELRLRFPALPLRELAARCEPPTTKATAHRRLQRLVRLAE